MSNKKIIEGNTADLEGLKRMNVASNIDKKEETDPKVIQQARLDAIERASEKLYSVIAENSDEPVVFSFEDMRHIYACWRSILGPARTSDMEYLYCLYQLSTKINTKAESDIRNGKRFMDMFEIRNVRDNNYLRLFDAVIIDNSVDSNNKNDLKSFRKYTFTKIDFPFQKLDINLNDLIKCESIFDVPKEIIMFPLIIALIGRVLDRFNTQFVVYLKENATNFNACDFAGYLNVQTCIGARWHDLIAAMQVQFDATFDDYIRPLEYGNIVIADPGSYFGISRDRIAPGYAHYGSGKVFGADNLELRNVFRDENIKGLLLTNTQAVRIEVMDEVYVHHRRVVHSASGENFHSLTAEVYYRFIPMLLPVPAIISTGLPDLRALQP